MCVAVCVDANDRAAFAPDACGSEQHWLGRGRDIFESVVHAGARGFVDCASGRVDWAEAEACCGSAAARADRGVRAGDGALPDYFADADSGGRRAGRWLDFAAAARHAVVFALQYYCGSDVDSHGLEGSDEYFPVWAR